jgi:hypothetical protein
MALSKDWQLKNVRGILRSLCNKLSLNDIEDLVLNDFIHLSVCSIAEQLNAGAYPDYGTSVVVTQTAGVIDLSTYRIESITKLVDSTNGECIQKDAHEIENISNVPQAASNIYYNNYGEQIFLKKGSSVASYGNLTLFYIRVPVKANADTDYIDLRDKYIDLLINQAKIMVYEQSSVSVPDSLMQSVKSNIAAIRSNNIQELQAIKAKEAK